MHLAKTFSSLSYAVLNSTTSKVLPSYVTEGEWVSRAADQRQPHATTSHNALNTVTGCPAIYTNPTVYDCHNYKTLVLLKII